MKHSSPSHNCLYCYEPVSNMEDFHEKCSLEFFGTSSPPALGYSLDQMDELAENVVKRSVAVPGVQPKLSMTVVNQSIENPANRLTVVGAMGGNYIFKPPSDRFEEMPENEHLTMRIAESFGIRVVPSSLIRLASGEVSYITKRIDRSPKGEKIHMLDMFQVTEAVDKYKSSMEKVGKALHRYSANTMLDQIFFLELALFAFLTGNNDMHLKNFSMIESPSGWILSPAYDLLNVAIIIPGDTEELALTLAGKKRKLTKVHFETLAKGLHLTEKQTRSVFNRMSENKSSAITWIRKSFLSQAKKTAYEALLERRYRQVE